MRFKYMRDPLFLACLALYLANRFVFEPLLSLGFFRCYVNDLICIPFWVPIMLFGMRRCRMRRDDDPPRSFEILIPLILWSAVFECWLPGSGLLAGRVVADHLDVLCYVVGACAAAAFWQYYYPTSVELPEIRRDHL
jgi:hypothetical protein